jgi:hypothetical protein
MKQFLYLIIFTTTISGCGQQKQPINSDANAQNKSKYKNLLAAYNNIAIDTLWVYSPDDSSNAYSGRALDSLNALFFPEDMAQRHFSEPPSLFAIYKFAIDANRLGLITRTPSEYVSSSIKLFIFDMKKDSLTSYIEIAESWGDAGDYMTKNSWLFRDSSQHLHALIDVTQGHDNSADDAKDTTVVEKDYYTLLDLSKPHIDTLFVDKEQLPKQYKSIMDRKIRL